MQKINAEFARKKKRKWTKKVEIGDVSFEINGGSERFNRRRIRGKMQAEKGLQRESQ